jgi:hypothetical protein
MTKSWCNLVIGRPVANGSVRMATIGIALVEAFRRRANSAPLVKITTGPALHHIASQLFVTIVPKPEIANPE